MSRKSDYRDIVGFKGLYKINVFGEVIAYDRFIQYPNCSIKIKIKKPKFFYDIDYKRLIVLKDKEMKNKTINVDDAIRNVFGRQKPLK